MKYRVKRAVPGSMIGGRFVPLRGNPDGPTQPLAKMAVDVIALATPAGITKRGKLRKNPRPMRSTTASRNPFNFTLQKKAQAADDRFQAALEKEYGSRAGDMRYQQESKFPPHIRKLARAKKTADEASHNYTVKYRRENPGVTVSGVREREHYPWQIPFQTKEEADGFATKQRKAGGKARVVKTRFGGWRVEAKGKTRRNPAKKTNRKLLSRDNSLPQDRWIPARVKLKKSGTMDVLVVAAGRQNPGLMKPYPESHRMGLHVRANGVHSRAHAAKEFEAWYDYRKHHIDTDFSKAQFKAEFMRGWGKR
jgi:hypothetical protein